MIMEANSSFRLRLTSYARDTDEIMTRAPLPVSGDNLADLIALFQELGTMLAAVDEDDEQDDVIQQACSLRDRLGQVLAVMGPDAS
jgi:hypothetical protein